MPYPSTDAFLKKINKYTSRSQKTTVAQIHIDEFGKTIDPTKGGFRGWLVTSFTGPTDDRIEKLKRRNYILSIAADDEAVQMSDDLTDFFASRFTRIKDALKAKQSDQDSKNENKIADEKKSESSVEELIIKLADELESVSLKRMHTENPAAVKRAMADYLLRRAKWEIEFPKIEYPGFFIHPDSCYAETLETTKSEVEILINDRLTQQIDAASSKIRGKKGVELAEAIYQAVPNLHHADEKEAKEIKQAIHTYLIAKEASASQPKPELKKVNSVALPESPSDVKDKPPLARMISVSTTRTSQTLSRFKCPDFYDQSRIIPPSNFANTIGWRAANPLYWPDAIVGSICSGFNKGVCAICNGILNGCDKLFAWGKDKPWYLKGPSYLLGAIGYAVTVPTKYALIAGPAIVETTTFAIATLGSGNVKDLANLSGLPRAFVGLREDNETLERRKTMSQMNLERKQSIDLVRKQSLSKGPSPAHRGSQRDLKINISPAHSPMNPSPSGKRSSGTSPSPLTPTLPGSIPESPTNLPTTATLKQSHNVVRHSLVRPGRLGSLVGDLDLPTPGSSPKHKRGTGKFGNLSVVPENVVRGGALNEELDTSSNEGPSLDEKDSEQKKPARSKFVR